MPRQITCHVILKVKDTQTKFSVYMILAKLSLITIQAVCTLCIYKYSISYLTIKFSQSLDNYNITD